MTKYIDKQATIDAVMKLLKNRGVAFNPYQVLDVINDMPDQNVVKSEDYWDMVMLLQSATEELRIRNGGR